jgi:hypothetical protein
VSVRKLHIYNGSTLVVSSFTQRAMSALVTASVRSSDRMLSSTTTGSFLPFPTAGPTVGDAGGVRRIPRGYVCDVGDAGGGDTKCAADGQGGVSGVRGGVSKRNDRLAPEEALTPPLGLPPLAGFGGGVRNPAVFGALALAFSKTDARYISLERDSWSCVTCSTSRARAASSAVSTTPPRCAAVGELCVPRRAGAGAAALVIASAELPTAVAACAGDVVTRPERPMAT